MTDDLGPRTLGEYRRLFTLLAGRSSEIVLLLDRKIAAQGEHAEVLADESQMMALLICELEKGRR